MGSQQGSLSYGALREVLAQIVPLFGEDETTHNSGLCGGPQPGVALSLVGCGPARFGGVCVESGRRGPDARSGNWLQRADASPEV